VGGAARILAALGILAAADAARGSNIPYYQPLDPLVFEPVPVAATSICPAPCYEVRVFIEDSSREVDIQAIQMDIDIGAGALPVAYPVPPATNSNAGDANAIYLDEDEERLVVSPWDLSATVGKSPSGFDVLLVAAASFAFDLTTLAAARTAFEGCAPARACAILEDADARNLVYLGRFKLTRDGAAPAFEVRVSGISGVGPLVEAVEYLQNYGRPGLVPYPAPEPELALLLGAALAAPLLRSCARSRAAPRCTRARGAGARPRRAAGLRAAPGTPAR
jgi:hypothetical protein